MTVIRRYSDAGIVMRGPTPDDVDFSLVSYQSQVLVDAGASHEETFDDMVCDVHEAATYDYEYRISVVPIILDSAEEIQILTVTPDIAVIDDAGTATRISDGIGSFVIGTRLLKKRLDLDFTRQIGQTSYQFNRYLTGSLAEHMQDQVAARLVGKSPETALKIFTVQNHAAKIYERNTGLWCSDIDQSCISPWNSYGGAARAGVAITPRHVAVATHYYVPNGATIRFITMDNQVVDKTVVKRTNVATLYDASILTLNDDLPESIRPCKILPKTYYEYAPSYFYDAVNMPNPAIPILATDREENALVFTSSVDSSGGWLNAWEPCDAGEAAFTQPIVTGDSSNPGFVIINGELCLVSTWTREGASPAGPFYPAAGDEINAIVATDGSYELDIVGLSEFTYFGET